MATFQLTKAEVEQLANFQSGSISFGPLTLNWNIDISIPQITVDASLLGVSIGHAVINKTNPTATLGGSVGFASANVTLSADFDKHELSYDVDVKYFGHSIKKNGVIFSW
jgi:hypothetical protein